MERKQEENKRGILKKIFSKKGGRGKFDTSSLSANAFYNFFCWRDTNWASAQLINIYLIDCLC